MVSREDGIFSGSCFAVRRRECGIVSWLLCPGSCGILKGWRFRLRARKGVDVVAMYVGGGGVFLRESD